MAQMYPVLVIAIGIAVLVLGKRLAVLGAAVGALLGAILLGLLSPSGSLLIQLLFVGGFAVAGFFLAGVAKAFVDIILLVIGAIGGAVIVLAFLGLFQIESNLFVWLLAIVGGVVGLMMVRRFKDSAMIVLAGLIGGLLVTRGLSAFPLLGFLKEGIWGALLTIVLAGGSIAYQGGFLSKGAQSTPPPAK